jgi:type II secretory pathway component HofQ
MQRLVMLAVVAGGLLMGLQVPAAAGDRPAPALEQGTFAEMDVVPPREFKKLPVLGDIPFLGHLFRIEQKPVERKVPILGDLPLLGRLFRIEPKPEVRKVPILGDLPFLGELFRTPAQR